MIRKVLYSVAILVLAGIAAALLAGSVVPRIMGAVPLTVLTGSMRPYLNPGDLAVVTPVLDPETIRVGEVISFRPESGTDTLVTHRVIEVSFLGDGNVLLTTKGDSNPSADEPIEGAQAVGRLVYRVPLVGHAAVGVQSEVRSLIAQGAGVVLIVSGVISTIRSSRRSMKGTQNDENTENIVPEKAGRGRRADHRLRVWPPHWWARHLGRVDQKPRHRQ